MRRARALSLAFLLAALPATAVAGDDVVRGTASWYGTAGLGVATQWCTWTKRHATGCGLLAVQSQQTGLVAILPVVDWCQCYRGTADERIVDLLPDAVAALGLDPAQGLYAVTTWRVDADSGYPYQATGMPDTAVVAR